MTEMEELDDRVRSFAANSLERTGVVTGWVLFVSTSRYDKDGDLLHAYDYSVGPDCDMMRAVGLVKLATKLMHSHIERTASDD